MLIGVTGGIAAGKTTFLTITEKLGYRTIDADRIVHESYLPGNAIFESVVQRWGTSVLGLDGEIDRAKLAEVVFNAPEELAWLNSVVHPIVLERVQAANKEADLSFFAVPLLFELSWQSYFDSVVCLWVNSAIQFERVRERGWDEGELARRNACQLRIEEKVRLSDSVIANSGTFKSLHLQALRFFEQIRQKHLG